MNLPIDRGGYGNISSSQQANKQPGSGSVPACSVRPIAKAREATILDR